MPTREQLAAWETPANGYNNYEAEREAEDFLDEEMDLRMAWEEIEAHEAELFPPDALLSDHDVTRLRTHQEHFWWVY